MNERCKERFPARRTVGAAWMRSLGLLLFAALCAGAGCGETSIAIPVHPVSGIVHWRGKPASQVLIVFHPQIASGKEDGSPVARPYAKTDADGNFWITTREPRDGAPAGEYAITLIWPPSEAEEAPGLKDKLGGRYADPERSLFRFDVQAGENVVPTIELQ
jgi:hypothetical protein